MGYITSTGCERWREMSPACAQLLRRRSIFVSIFQTPCNYRSGAIGMLNVSLSYPLLAFRETGGPLVVCQKGGIRCVPFLDHINIYRQHHDDSEAHLERFDDLGFDHAFRTELRDFVRWIREDTPPCLTWSEGIRCVEVMEAARRSIKEGGAVVQLPLYTELE
jgi:predicted dehydrogenase